MCPLPWLPVHELEFMVGCFGSGLWIGLLRRWS